MLKRLRTWKRLTRKLERVDMNQSRWIELFIDEDGMNESDENMPHEMRTFFTTFHFYIFVFVFDQSKGAKEFPTTTNKKVQPFISHLRWKVKSQFATQIHLVLSSFGFKTNIYSHFFF
jgi:hypothetical protein